MNARYQKELSIREITFKIQFPQTLSNHMLLSPVMTCCLGQFEEESKGYRTEREEDSLISKISSDVVASACVEKMKSIPQRSI